MVGLVGEELHAGHALGAGLFEQGVEELGSDAASTVGGVYDEVFDQPGGSAFGGGDEGLQAGHADHAPGLLGDEDEGVGWFAEEGAMHIIHGGESSNGWQRPQEGDALLYLSRRTPLTLRLPAGRVEEAQRRLNGATLDVAGSPMRLAEGKPRLLAKTTTLYARYVDTQGLDEDGFLRASIDTLRGRGIGFKKILCGRSRTLHTPAGPIETRSLMLSDLGLGDSIRLQEEGLGPHRALGCGLFIAHKTV